MTYTVRHTKKPQIFVITSRILRCLDTVPRLNRSEEIRPKPSEVVFSAVFLQCRLEVAGDVISGAALVRVGVDVHAKIW